MKVPKPLSIQYKRSSKKKRAHFARFHETSNASNQAAIAYAMRDSTESAPVSNNAPKNSA
jgi:hypothetical protein